MRTELLLTSAAATALLFGATVVLAQSSEPDHGRAAQETQMPEGMRMDQAVASQAYMDAMRTMMEGMASMEMTGDAAIDFAMMMIPHHQSAIDMARVFLQHSDDPELTELANAIITEQQREIEFLQNWLRERGR